MQNDRGKTRDWPNIAARLTAQLEEFGGVIFEGETLEDVEKLRQETLAEFLRREFGREDAN